MKCKTCKNEIRGRGRVYCSKVCFYSDANAGGRFQKGRLHPLKGTGLSKREHDGNYYEKHKDKIKEKKRIYNQRAKEKLELAKKLWVKKNPEKNRAIKKAWRERNRGTVISWQAKRRALFREAMTETTDSEKIRQFYILAERLTEQTGTKYVVDHIKPIIKGGKHHQDNLQVITLSENSRKKDIYPYKVEHYYLPNLNPGDAVEVTTA